MSSTDVISSDRMKLDLDHVVVPSDVLDRYLREVAPSLARWATRTWGPDVDFRDEVAVPLADGSLRIVVEVARRADGAPFASVLAELIPPGRWALRNPVGSA